MRALAFALVIATTVGAYALGILVPRPADVSAVRLGDVEVKVEITNNLAKTRVVQDFYNPNPRQLEADFYFPVPRGANVTDFVLYMNGKPVKGEVLEKDKAREIYEGIVRRMKDPGLLEWVDYSLFKVRVFPVPANGTQRIELEFAQPLEADQGTFKYAFPLKTPRSFTASAATKSAFKFAIDITSDEPLRNVYSPSHKIDTDLKDPSRARINLPLESLQSTGDFLLFYEFSKKDLAVSLVTCRPGSGDGFFSLMISPQMQYDRAKAEPIDVVFVIDSSGSMSDDNKIEQARKALTYCVGQLKDSDRFSVIRFSTEVEKFRDKLMAAAPGTRDEARAWIGQLTARGGTNISGALQEALALREAGDEKTSASATGRVFTVVFITDGLPTLGITDPAGILQAVGPKRAGQVRIFTFGVGNDVNTKLLDRLADESRAVSEYIRPGQDMEVPISRFFDKVSAPAMTGLKLDIPGADVYDLYPKDLPDLFYGTQLTVFGRYKKPAPSAIKLTGFAGGRATEFVFEKTFPEKTTGNEFVEKLWGTRKIAYLLDEVRAHGESTEVKDEIVQLAKKYGVVTPYTSYLVAEDVSPRATPEPPRHVQWQVPLDRDRRAGPLGLPGPVLERSAAFAGPAASAGVSARGGQRDQVKMMSEASVLRSESGEEAVFAAQAIRGMKQAERSGTDNADNRKTVGERTFRLVNGVWTDTQIKPDERSALVIRYLSDAYFEAVRLNPALGEIFALGERVKVRLAGGVVEIGESGKETLEAQDVKILAP